MNANYVVSELAHIRDMLALLMKNPEIRSIGILPAWERLGTVIAAIECATEEQPR